MRIKLNDRLVSKLLSLPESGMGYQRVDVRLANGRELRDVMVFNAQELDVPDEVASLAIVDVELHENRSARSPKARPRKARKPTKKPKKRPAVRSGLVGKRVKSAKKTT